MKFIIALIIFGIIIFIHELGHFLLAKANGIFVEEFAIGMGPTLFSFQKKETKYSLKLLPLGGSCMMKGEDEASADERAFNNKTLGARFAVVFAGPFFNFVLAFILAIVLIALVGGDQPAVLDVTKNSPAQEAGLQKGDIIEKYNGSRIGVGREIYLEDYINPVGKQDISIQYKRNGKSYKTILTPQKKTRYLMGMSYSSNDKAATVSISDDSPLAKAGLKNNDCIVAIDGTKIASGKELNKYIQDHPLTGADVSLSYQREGKTYDASVTPVKDEYYETGFLYNTNYKNAKVSVMGTLKYSLLEIRYQIKSVVLSLKYLITGHFSADSVAGPVGIVNFVGDAYSQSIKVGWLPALESMLSICIMLSANLGVMNLLPIPALDGGRLLFMIIELIRGKKVDPEKEGFVHFIGFVLLMALMVVIMFNDIRNIFIK